MAKKVKVNFQGKEFEGEQLNFDIEKENWNSYKTEDGSIIKLKVVVSKITRLSEYNELGEPIYVVNSTNLIDADVPDNLKKGQSKTKEKMQ